MRVAFHAIDGVGLGHLVRLRCIAREVRALDPAAEILFLTNARDVSLLEADGFDHVRMPPRLGEPHADPQRVFEGLADDLDVAACLGAIEAFAPDLVVFDTHGPPQVVRGAADLGARVVLVLRELRPGLWAAWLASPAATDFDRILVPHEADEVDPATLPRELPIAVVGPVVRETPGRAASSAPAECDVATAGRREPDGGTPAPDASAPHVVVLAGAGGQPVDALRFLRAAADAHWLVRARIPTLRTTIVAGPNAARLPSYDGLTVLGPVPDAPEIAAGADLVVSQAGFNAIAELRAMRKPAVLVPGRRRAEDQSARVRRLTAIGAAVRARPDSQSIATRVGALLADPARLGQMSEAHGRRPLIPRNREAAVAALRVIRRPAGPVRKVVLVAHDFPPRVGGMETVAREAAAGLARQGLEVVVLTTRRIGAAGLPGVRVLPVFTPLRDPRNIDLLRDLLLTIDVLGRETPDAVHLCHAGLAPWIPALRATWPAVVTVSVHGNDLLAPWVESGASDEAYRDAIAAGLRTADCVVAVSAFSAAAARSRGARANCVRVVPNGVDPVRFAPAPPGCGSPVRADILTVSRLAARKGHETVLRALPLLPGVRYAYTGEHERLGAGLAELARQLGVAGRVEALGRVPDADLPALYRRARVFVLVPDERDAADVEGFGVALLEAGASGLPVVASRTGGIPEAVEDGVTGILVPAGDAAATAAAIRSLLDDPARAAEMGRRGRERALAYFSWDATCAGLRAAWDGAGGGEASIEPLRRLVTADAATDDPQVLGLRTAIAGVTSAAALARLARFEAREERARSAQRRASNRRAAEQGRRVRLRATGSGERILAAALADCRADGTIPDVEVRLRRFLDPVFRACVLPDAGDVYVHHSVPSGDPASTLRAVRALPDADVRRVRSLRIHLAGEADAATALACVPEIHALREALTPSGASVLPPPDLMRYLSLTPSGTPPTAMIEPTNRCNLACPTCPTGTGKIAPLRDMDAARFASALGGLVPGLRNLALWNYGEPTLNRHLPEMIAEAKRRGVGVVKVSSNVHFLDGERGAALLASGLDVLILSVDGASEETYSKFRVRGDFARVAAAVRGLCEEKARRGLAQPRIELQFIAMRHNEHEVPEIRRLAAEWGVDRLRIKTFGAEDGVNRDLVPGAPDLSRYGEDRATPNRSRPFCTMAWDHTVVNVDGSVTPCCYLRPDMGDAFVMGNVFRTPFREIWRGERYREFRAAMLRDRGAMPVCDRCRGGTHDLIAAVEEVQP